MEILLSWIIPEQYELLALVIVSAISYTLWYITAKRVTIKSAFPKLLWLMFISLFLWKVFNWESTGVVFEFITAVSFFFVTWIQAEKMGEYINTYMKIKWK